MRGFLKVYFRRALGKISSLSPSPTSIFQILGRQKPSLFFCCKTPIPAVDVLRC